MIYNKGKKFVRWRLCQKHWVPAENAHFLHMINPANPANPANLFPIAKNDKKYENYTIKIFIKGILKGCYLTLVFNFLSRHAFH